MMLLEILPMWARILIAMGSLAGLVALVVILARRGIL